MRRDLILLIKELLPSLGLYSLEMLQKVRPFGIILIDVRALSLAHHYEVIDQDASVVFADPPGLI